MHFIYFNNNNYLNTYINKYYILAKIYSGVNVTYNRYKFNYFLGIQRDGSRKFTPPTNIIYLS